MPSGADLPLCIYCSTQGPFSTVQHIIPESFFNGDYVIRDAVCDNCQKYFGTKVESFVLSKTLFAYPRYVFRQKNKKGKSLRLDMSVPREPKGAIPTHSLSQDNLRFRINADGSRKISICDKTPRPAKLPPGTFQMVITPMALRTMGQFCLKVGLETIALDSPEFVRGPHLRAAREYARYGIPNNTYWPIYIRNIFPAFVDGQMGITMNPIIKDQLWCEFDVSMFKFKFDLLSATEHPPPSNWVRAKWLPWNWLYSAYFGYILLRPAPNSDRE